MPLETLQLYSLLLTLAWWCVLRWLLRHSASLALASLIGTVLHEACHAAVGWTLRAKPVSLKLWPRREGQRWILGSVGFTGLNLLNAAPVTLAPLLLAPAAYLLTSSLMPYLLSHEHLLTWLLMGYCAASCASACLPSAQDLRVGAGSILLYAALSVLAWAAW